VFKLISALASSLIIVQSVVPVNASETKKMEVLDILGNVETPTLFTTQITTKVKTEDVYLDGYFYYLNTISKVSGEPVQVNFWLKNVDFPTDMSKNEKRMNICTYLSGQNIEKKFLSSFNEPKYGTEFVSNYFADFCKEPVEQAAEYNNCQANLSKSILPWGKDVEATCIYGFGN
jgi:hypothetical protein